MDVQQQNKYTGMSVVFAAILLLALGGVGLAAMRGDLTGQVSTYQQIPYIGGVQSAPDPHTQYFIIGDGFCDKYITNPAGALRLIDRQCQELNHGRQKREGDCRYQAELEAELTCRPAPVFSTMEQPRYLTGMVATDPLSCAGTAENYDIVLRQAFERAKTPLQTIAVINPCTAQAEAANRQTLAVDAPLREYVRTAFVDGDVMGHIAGDEDVQGQVRYVRCNAGQARVIVSGVPVCNSLG
jgi:hypothetical protein